MPKRELYQTHRFVVLARHPDVDGEWIPDFGEGTAEADSLIGANSMMKDLKESVKGDPRSQRKQFRVAEVVISEVKVSTR